MNVYIYNEHIISWQFYIYTKIGAQVQAYRGSFIAYRQCPAIPIWDIALSDNPHKSPALYCPPYLTWLVTYRVTTTPTPLLCSGRTPTVTTVYEFPEIEWESILNVCVVQMVYRIIFGWVAKIILHCIMYMAMMNVFKYRFW